jgi:hypothetical protein
MTSERKTFPQKCDNLCSEAHRQKNVFRIVHTVTGRAALTLVLGHLGVRGLGKCWAGEQTSK